VNPNSETNRASNWQSAAQTIGFGTPGLQNSVFRLESITESEVSLSSKRFTPNNDGVDDRLLINFNLKETGYWVNIRIFNSMGKQIRKLASNISIAQEDQLYWDGLGSNKERLPIGIYVVYIELFNEAGDVKNFKKTCVLGGKFN
jgi:flagellar hook assembly protein FlgD